MLDNRLPGGQDEDSEMPEGEEAAAGGSLSDDVVALIDDGKTLVEAEIAFQKSRLAFAVNRGKSGLFFGVCAFAVLHLALVALVIGAILALTPLISAAGATAIVVSLLVVAGAIFGIKARSRFARLVEAYEEAKE